MRCQGFVNSGFADEFGGLDHLRNLLFNAIDIYQTPIITCVVCGVNNGNHTMPVKMIRVDVELERGICDSKTCALRIPLWETGNRDFDISDTYQSESVVEEIERQGAIEEDKIQNPDNYCQD